MSLSTDKPLGIKIKKVDLKTNETTGKTRTASESTKKKVEKRMEKEKRSDVKVAAKEKMDDATSKRAVKADAGDSQKKSSHGDDSKPSKGLKLKIKLEQDKEQRPGPSQERRDLRKVSEVGSRKGSEGSPDATPVSSVSACLFCFGTFLTVVS